MDTIDRWTTADTGYGSSQYSINCSSAVALLGLLGLIELLRDTMQEMVPTGRRTSATDLLAPDLTSTLPGILFPLLHNLVDAQDGLVSPDCMSLTVCESNSRLTKDDQLAASLLAELLTQVSAGSVLGASSPRLLERALRAAEEGRSGARCKALYGHCVASHQYAVPYTHLW